MKLSFLAGLVLLSPLVVGASDSVSSITLSAGPGSSDFPGSDNATLQRAADELARRAPDGTGVLLIQPGTYTMYDSLHLRAPMTVRGHGRDTVLLKCPQFRTKLLQDFDLSEYTVKVEDPTGLRVGMGVTIKDQQQQSGWDPTVRTIVAIDGHDVRLDRRPERDYAFAHKAWLQNSFPVVEGSGVHDLTIEDLVTDGNLDQNRDIGIDGCRGGGIYLHEARNCTIRRCLSRNYNGDGISWQTTDNVLVEDCESTGHTGLGLHPGTGSPNTTVRNCHAHHNGQIGLFLCWGVRHGRFENNLLEDNGMYGISIGHKDTDNLFQNNTVRRNGKAGVYFRNEPTQNAGHRCTLVSNTIEDNGTPTHPGAGVRIDGATTHTTLQSNTIRDTRPQSDRTQTIAVEVGEQAGAVTLTPDNHLEGAVKNQPRQTNAQ